MSSGVPPPQVIIVDDEQPLVDLMCNMLKAAHITAEGYTSGLHAYDNIRRKHPQIVILDVMMPEIDGLAFFRQLRSDPVTAEIPVIFVTVSVDHVARELPDYRTRGALLLRKPFHIGDLLDIVQKTLNNRATTN